MVTGGRGSRRRTQTTGVAYSGLCIALLAVIAAVALTATQSSPPAIAELAPQAQKQIVEAPEEQTSEFGKGAGGAATGDPATDAVGTTGSTATTTTTTAPPGKVIEKGRVRRCVGEPPRQTEDPQSPPCVPFFEGQNGGATSKGVSATQVRVAVGVGEDLPGDMVAMETFLNNRFEFYGRKIVFVPFEPAGGTGGGQANPTAEAADAVKVDESLPGGPAFAAAVYPDRYNEAPYWDELSRRKVVGVNSRPPVVGESHLRRMAPFQWSYLPGVETVGRNLGEWMCKGLQGGTAERAGGTLAGRQRKFGLFVTQNSDGSKPELGPLRAAGAACGLSFAEEVEVRLGDPPPLSEITSAIIKLKSAEVTSVLCMCHSAALANAQAVAVNQAYFPEWLISTYQYNDEDVGGRIMAQADRTFGLSFWNKPLPTPQTWWDQAIREVDPGHRWVGGNLDAQTYRFRYYALLLLASGIQLAGPNLTPQTFADGLHRARFPNPNARRAPFYQATVQFAPGDQVMNDDAAVVWWNPTERSYQDHEGTYCWAAAGLRYGAGAWPSPPPRPYTGPCR